VSEDSRYSSNTQHVNQTWCQRCQQWNERTTTT